jgi:hypothetical protein
LSFLLSGSSDDGSDAFFLPAPARQNLNRIISIKLWHCTSTSQVLNIPNEEATHMQSNQMKDKIDGTLLDKLFSEGNHL